MRRKEISFKGQTIYVGINVHKTIWVVTVMTEVGNYEKKFSIPASPQKFFEKYNIPMQSSLEKRKRMCLFLVVTGYLGYTGYPLCFYYMQLLFFIMRCGAMRTH